MTFLLETDIWFALAIAKAVYTRGVDMGLRARCVETAVLIRKSAGRFTADGA
jgi:hypothetical protein